MKEEKKLSQEELKKRIQCGVVQYYTCVSFATVFIIHLN